MMTKSTPKSRTVSILFLLVVLISISTLSLAIECSSPESCKQIDEVWYQKLGSLVRSQRNVWDPISSQWKDFNILYPPPPPPPPAPQQQAPSQVKLPELCFPVTKDSFTTNHENFGSPRTKKEKSEEGEVKIPGGRCHAGIDLYTKHPGRSDELNNVVAIDDGIVVNIDEDWYDCSGGWSIFIDRKTGIQPISAVFVYHPNLQIGGTKGVTINYGEIDTGHIASGIAIGQSVRKGQSLGRAGYCGMLHLEAYQGRTPKNEHWYPPAGQTVSSKNECREKYLKPSTLIDPTQFLQSISGNFCQEGATALDEERIQAPQEERYGELEGEAESELIRIELEGPATSLNMPPASKLSTMSAEEKFTDALTKAVIIGKTIVLKLSGNGENDDYFRKGKGRETIFFKPESTDLSRPVEIIYFFHGLTGFNTDIYTRLVPQSKQMVEDGRNFILVFPELPWSAGTNSAKRAKGRQRTIWNGEDSDIIIFHNQVLSTIADEFSVSQTTRQMPQISRIVMVGHSAGGAAIKFAAARANTDEYYNGLETIGPTVVTLSDSDYIWGSKSVSQTIYDNYISQNPGTYLNMIVQDPNQNSAHSPTAQAIYLMKKIGGESTQDWTYIHCQQNIFSGCNTRGTKEYYTPGAQAGALYNSKSPDKGTVNYLPLSKGHLEIGTLSLAFLPPELQSS